MSELQRFLPQDQELLSGLLYRVGYWISNVDDTDEGNESGENRTPTHDRMPDKNIKSGQKQGIDKRDGS